MVLHYSFDMHFSDDYSCRVCFHVLFGHLRIFFGEIYIQLLFFKNFFYFLTFDCVGSLWLCWVFVAAHRLSLVAASRGSSSLRCAGFSLRWLLLLWSMGSRHEGSVVVAHGL